MNTKTRKTEREIIMKKKQIITTVFATAVAAGEADLGFMADLPAIIAKSTGQEIEIVSNVAYGEKAIAVLVSPDSDIKSVADLKGKKVAYATGSYAQHLLALLLDQEGLSLKDVESVNLGAGDQPAALANGQVDALHYSEK